MTIQPKNMSAFLNALGEGYIRRALVNDEFSGKTKASAEQWLAQRSTSWTRTLATVFGSMTAIGVVGGLVFGIGRLLGWGS